MASKAQGSKHERNAQRRATKTCCWCRDPSFISLHFFFSRSELAFFFAAFNRELSILNFNGQWGEGIGLPPSPFYLRFPTFTVTVPRVPRFSDQRSPFFRVPVLVLASGACDCAFVVEVEKHRCF